MANSLEARSPFLDHNVIEFAASLPEHIKMRGMRPKYLLKKVAARLVPREVVYRRKMGFGVPVGRWLRGEMSDFLRDVLLSQSSLARGIVRRKSFGSMSTSTSRASSTIRSRSGRCSCLSCGSNVLSTVNECKYR